jgi:uncharacterized protein YjiS (DUF1127 family)
MQSNLALAPYRSDNFRLRDIVRQLAKLALRWRGRCRERHSLSELDARMLADIGLSPADRETECAKPFWQA